MAATTFKLEDLELQIPQVEGQSTKTRIYKSLHRGGFAQQTEKSTDYSMPYVHNTPLTQFEELAANPYFACVPIYGLDDRINTGVIKSLGRDWHFNYSDVSFSLTKGYGKFLFLFDETERPIHNRWRILISEDFDTDAAWPTNGALVGTTTPGNSLGDTDQLQDIPWNERYGSWETDTDAEYFLSGTQSLECVSSGSWAYVHAGWERWENYEAEVWILWDDVLGAADHAGITFRGNDNGYSFYRFYYHATDLVYKLSLLDSGAGTNITQSSTTVTIAVDTWYHFKIRVQGHRIQCYVNGEEIFDKENTYYSSGFVGLISYGDNIHFDNFKVILLPPVNFNLPASVDWSNQYSVADIETAHGTQQKLIAPDNNVQFKQSKAGSDCVLYLPMNEGQGDTIHDHSKYRNNFTMGGFSWAEDNEKGNCLESTDDSNHASIVNANALDYNIGFTVDIEVNAVNFDDPGYVFSFTGAADCRVYMIFGASTIKFVTGTYVEWGLIPISADTWYRITMIVFPITSTTATCFALIDGKEVARYDVIFGGDGTVDTYNLGSEGYTHHTGRYKNLRVYSTPRWDVAYGHDSTPATVFVHDTNQFDKVNYDYPDDSDLLLLLHADEGSGAMVYDASGNGLNPTAVSFPPWQTTSARGEMGTCLNFSGSHYLEFGADDIEGYKNLSFSCWTQMDDSGLGVFFRKEYSFAIGKNAAEYVGINIGDGVGWTDSTLANTPLTVGKWQYVVVTFEDTKVKIYIDGVLDLEDTLTDGPDNVNTQKFIIGAYSDPWHGQYLDARLDEMRVFKRVLSAEEIAARYRSEPYLHDFYQCTRVYHHTHPFKGLPIISNGLIMLSFSDYDTYEQRVANCLTPEIYAWYENSWHLLGQISPLIVLNGAQFDINDLSGSDYEIEELTDQYCKIRMRYYTTDAAFPEGTYVDLKIIIRNGFQGVLIETDDSNWKITEGTGFFLDRQLITGHGMKNIFVYMPEDQLYDSRIVASVLRNSTEIDDNWCITFSNADDSDAPNKNFITGFFTDAIYDDLDTGDLFQIIDSGNIYAYAGILGLKYGGIFFVPYDVDDLFQEADSDYADVTTDGANDQQALAGYTGDGYIHLNDAAVIEYAQWDVGTGNLPKGSYIAIARVASNNPAGERGMMYVDNDNDHDGDLASKILDLAVQNTWQYDFLPFYTDGTNDVWISCTSDVNENLFVDHWFCIPLSDAINYPNSLAEQAFSDTKLQRGLKK